MKRFRALATQSPAIVISVIALTFSLGGGAGYAASTVTSQATAKVSWHRLTLRGSWKPAAAGFRVGRPEYAVSNGVVYLTGVAARANQTLSIPATVGTLPRGARPTHNLWFTAFNYAAANESWIEVATNGNVIVGGNGGDENFFTSLAGISFPLGA
jgi:hypothetical protein